MHRRIVLLLGLGLAVGSSTVLAVDSFEITPFIAYRGGDSIPASNTNLGVDSVSVGSGEAYGLYFNMGFGEHWELELSWSRQPTELTANGSAISPFNDKIFDLNIDYYMVAGVYQFGMEGDTIRPYFGFMAGVTYFDTPSGYSSNSRFGWGLEGGAKFYFSENIGIRLNGRWNTTYINSTPALWCQPYFPFYCYTVSAGNYLDQGEIDAGLIIRF